MATATSGGEITMGVCSECIHWRNEQWIMNKYGEGCGICQQDGEIRFYSHQCSFCETKEQEE